MADPGHSAFDLGGTYVHLRDGLAAAPVPVGADFWQTIDARTDLEEGRLVMVNRMADDWPHWEMHPAGDEIVYLLSGAMDLVLDEAGGARTVRLRAGEAVIVPKGIWHRGIVHRAGEALFITPGAGTQHRPR
ncbi:MAG TPA: cupin domain-containing protein [Vineibacter sp.]|nr:cupin domain-containing protein [Vineibacter sp.]